MSITIYNICLRRDEILSSMLPRRYTINILEQQITNITSSFKFTRIEWKQSET